VGVDRRAADRALLELVPTVEGAEQLKCGPHDLGADPVAGQGHDPRHVARTVPALL
jgi:hypothetical protein